LTGRSTNGASNERPATPAFGIERSTLLRRRGRT
jgi:hypothetical protein